MSLFSSQYAKFHKDGELVITDRNDIYIGSMYEEEAKELYETMKEYFENKYVPNKIIFESEHFTVYESGDMMICTGDMPVVIEKGKTLHLMHVLKQHFLDNGWSPNDFISIKWHISDVLERAKELKIEITEEEARDVLAHIELKHDANMGVSWDVIDFWIETLHGGYNVTNG